MSTTHGWTTWDASSIAVWEHLPSGLRCQLVLEDNNGQQLSPTGWETLEETLPDDAGHSMAHLRVLADSGEVEIECGGQGDLGACRIANILGENLQAHWDISGSLDGWQVSRGDFDVVFAPADAALPDDASAFLREQWDVARQARPRGELRLLAPIEAMETTLAANTFLVPNTDEMLTMSRHAMEVTGEWRLLNWQTFLTALSIAYLDPQLAVANCKSALKLLAADGILGAERTAQTIRRDISNPPVAAFCVWKIYQMTGDVSLLDDSYRLLLHWHDWWRNARDGNQNLLLNWASVAETGMPGHPLYETAPTDPQTGIMRVDDVALCSLWALDAFALMRMALQRNDLDQATHLEAEINDIAGRMNLLLWDRDFDVFRSRDWDGFYTDRLSATIFLSLAGSIPTRSHVDRLLRHLDLDYTAPFLVPTLGPRDPDFEKQQPWCGRVSPLLNYLICEGLRQFGYDELAETITLSGLNLLEHSWQQHQVFDSYNARTGMGDDIAQDPLAPTGMLLGALGIGMLVDAEPWNGLRMGNLRGLDMGIRDFHLHGETYDLTSGPWGFAAVRNGDPWFDFDHPAILRNLSQNPTEISCGLKLPGGGKIRMRFHGYTPGNMVSLRVNGNVTQVQANKQGIVDCELNLDSQHGGSGIWHRAA